jgi:hypothetical protein
VTVKARSAAQRFLLVLGMCAYVGCFQWVYINYLYPTWGYFGFGYNRPTTGYLILAFVLSVVPSVWIPLELTRPSLLAYWVLYFTVMIPSMFVPLYMGLNPLPEIGILMVVIFAGFVIVGTSYRVPKLRLNYIKIPSGSFWKGFTFVALALTIWVVVGFWKDLRILSFADIYDLRDSADDKFGNSLLNYPLMWLSGAIDPILMACGLHYRRKLLFLAGALGQLVVYSAIGTKGSILSIVFVVGFYFLFKIERIPFALKMACGALAVLTGPALAYAALSGKDAGSLLATILFVVLMRTLGINGLLTAQYYDFFQRSPLTYYSHVKGISWFVHYPYANPMGVEVGSFYSGDATLDATAHFWAMDGLAAMGLTGVLLISVLCAFVFWLLDSVAAKHDVRLAALMIAYTAYNLANIPLFTTLLSGGLGLLMVFFYLAPSQGEPRFSVLQRKVKNRAASIPSPGAVFVPQK